MKRVLKSRGARVSIVVLFAYCAAAQQSAETARETRLRVCPRTG